MPKIIFSVSNDLVHDQRVLKTIRSIQKKGYQVTFVGRKLDQSHDIPRDWNFRTKRFKLPFSKGALFYASLNFRLFWYLLFQKTDIYLANDLDTLLPNYLAARLRGKRLVYDSHEYFTEVPELQGRVARKVWLLIEKFVFPKLNQENVYTVNPSIQQAYEDKYKVKVGVIRNVTSIEQVKEPITVDKPKKFRIILQGAGINIDRGGEEMVEAMALLSDDYELLIVGSGDAIPEMQKRAIKLNLGDKVQFKGKVPYTELRRYTASSHLGVSLDKPNGMNYTFSLPNKLFDYIHAGVPVLVSNLPEVAQVVKRYEVGVVLEAVTPESIATSIQGISREDLKLYHANCLVAAKDLVWENQEDKLYDYILG